MRSFVEKCGAFKGSMVEVARKAGVLTVKRAFESYGRTLDGSNQAASK
jgi:molybdenum cofactor biosynthesis enzyme